MRSQAKAQSTRSTISRRVARPVAVLRVFARTFSGEVGRNGALSSLLLTRMQRRALCSTLVFLAVMVTLLRASSFAFATELPVFEGPNKVIHIHATNAYVELGPVHPGTGENTYVTEDRIEYSTSETGPFTVADRVIYHDGENATALRAELTHLTPETTYYVHLFAETASGGRSTEKLKFVTLPPGAPELTELQASVVMPENEPEIGDTSATFQDNIETNALETNYNFEYASSEAGPYSSFTSEATGNVTVAEESETAKATVSGLTPETTYYVRVTAENTDGHSSETTSFTTEPAHPTSVNIVLNAIDVTGTSAFLIGNFDSHSYEAHWRFEYSTSENGTWTIGPEGTVLASEANERENFAGPVEISGLSPDTKYYVRLYVDNGHGTPVISSDIESFQTAGPPVVSTFPTHAIEGESMRALGFVNPNASPVDELQTLTVGGNPSGGTYTLSFEGNTTAPIPFDAGYYEVEEALWTLRGLNPTNVMIYETQGSSYTIEFVGALGGIKVPQITADASGLTPSGTVSVATLQEGFAYATTYHVEYVSQPEFEETGWAAAMSAPSLTAAAEGVVGENLPNLKSGETYHFRLVASNTTPGNPVVDGNEETLRVPTAAPEETPAACPNEALRTGPSAHLPDCRAYEQVTPVEKGGAQDAFRYPTGLTEGTLISTDGDHVFLHDPGVNWEPSPDPVQGNYFLSRTSTGWHLTSTKPAGETGPNSLRPEIFSPDLTQIGLSSAWGDSGAAESTEVEFKVGPPGGPYRLVASIPRSEAVKGGGLVAASADGSKYILQSTDRTLAGHRTGTTSGNDLYEFSEGQLRQLNVLGGSPGATISACGAEMAVGAEGEEDTEASSGEHAISPSGSRVFFTDNCTHHLYMRVNGVETVDLGEYNFIAANAEGSKLLLEKHSGNSYEIFLDETETQTVKYLFSTNKAAIQVGSESNAFRVSEDFSTIYFTSTGQLTPEAPPAINTEPDVYRYDIATKTLFFVMQGSAPRYVSPDGSYFYFGYAPTHNTPHIAGLSTPDEQVYSYDSTENMVECVSCASSFDPSPKFPAVLSTEDGTAPHNNGAPVTSVASANGDYVFFDTASALLPQDVDGERSPESCNTDCHPITEFYSKEYSPSSDVYEWRKNGVDGCTHIQGCLALITTGKGGFLNMLLGTDSSGRDVFFATDESLVSSDRDTASDIYDARVGGGFPPPAPGPVECEGDSCSTPFAVPNDLTPSSSTFQGAGNLSNGVLPQTKTKPKSKPKKKSTKKKKPKKKTKPKTKKTRKTGKKAKKSNQRRGK